MPSELLDQTARDLDGEGFHQLWRALDELRQNLDTGRGVVKVGRLFFPCCDY